METTKITPTVKLNNGLTVAGKLHRGEPCALTYANRTQAEKAAAKLGAGWAVCRGASGWGGVFYVGQVAQ